ncbi:MAG: hypothetical protein IKN72_04665 [Clostridia bacterium]|nr:hypothetical protein [Clostridia bacterium]
MKKISAIVLVILTLLGFTLSAVAAPVYLYDSDVIPAGGMYAVAHRGYSAVAPENTLPAFRLAGEYGFWGAECDISQTKDGVWVLMHDDTVDRMTDGTGLVSAFTYDEIAALTIDAGANVQQFPNTKIPTLVEYLDVCRQYGLHPVIEIKSIVNEDSLPGLAAVLRAREEKDAFVIISFGREIVTGIKALLPEVPTYLLSNPGTAEDIDFCVENGIDGIDVSYLTPAQVLQSAQTAGLKTMIWTVDSMDVAESGYLQGVTDLTTNLLVPGKTACPHTTVTFKRIDESSHRSVCTLCGKATMEHHTYGDWAVVKEATTDETGLAKRTCNACGATETQTIAKLEKPKQSFFSRIAQWFRNLFNKVASWFRF